MLLMVMIGGTEMSSSTFTYFGHQTTFLEVMSDYDHNTQLTLRAVGQSFVEQTHTNKHQTGDSSTDKHQTKRMLSLTFVATVQDILKLIFHYTSHHLFKKQVSRRTCRNFILEYVWPTWVQATFFHQWLQLKPGGLVMTCPLV